jgi:hypothetical protein
MGIPAPFPAPFPEAGKPCGALITRRNNAFLLVRWLCSTPEFGRFTARAAVLLGGHAALAETSLTPVAHAPTGSQTDGFLTRKGHVLFR